MPKESQAIRNVVISSLRLADATKKRHDHIVRLIEKVLPIVSKYGNDELLYWQTAYRDGSGRHQPMYLMNRDGFCFLLLISTGKQSLKWRQAYVNVFTRTEERLFEAISAERGKNGAQNNNKRKNLY